MSTTSWKLAAAGLGVIALSGLSACGTSDARTADLEYVDGNITSRQDLFLDTSLENRPMTLEQLGGARDSAIAVEIEIFGPVAAAWRRADDGSSLPRVSDNLVSLWRVHDVVDGSAVLPTSGVVDGGSVDYVPGSEVLPRVEGVDIERPGDRLASALPDENLYVLVDWVDRLGRIFDTDAELARILSEQHPGCL